MIHMIESKGKGSRICLWPRKKEISKPLERQLLTRLNGNSHNNNNNKL